MKNRKSQVRTKIRQIEKLQERLENVIKSKGVEVDDRLHGGLLDVMKTTPIDNENFFPVGSLKKLFWMQQMKAASVSDKRQMRWHPLIIRWCLSLKLSSSAAYQAMKDTGFITLPYERTLRDYTHIFRPKPGIQHEVNDQLAAEAKLDQLEEWQTHVCVVFDEVKIKEGLVYDKYTGYILGFTDLGTINQEIDKLEKIDKRADLATSMLVFMVCGLFIRLKFPYAQFPCKTLSGAVLSPIIWDVVRCLELIGLMVVALTGDGASLNRKFFAMHGTGLVNKVKNPYSDDDRYIYFFLGRATPIKDKS
jgi:hypothetical protein